MKPLIQLLIIFTLIIFVFSCKNEGDKINNSLLADCCRAINDDNACTDKKLKQFEERLKLGEYDLPNLYYLSDTRHYLKFSEFCEQLNLSKIALLKFGSWIWVKEKSPYGTVIPSEKGYSETRLFNSNFQQRTINGSAPEESKFTLIDDLIKSTDKTGYETIERIIKLTVDTLVVRIDKFQNTKTYVNDQLFIHNLEYSKKLSTPNRKDIDIYHSIANSITYSKPPINVKSIEELTNKNGISLSTTFGRIYSNDSLYTGYAYDIEDVSIGAYSTCSGCKIKIFKVKDGYKNGFQLEFRYHTYPVEIIELYESSFWYNGYLTGRRNRYSPIDSQPLRIIGSSFYIYGVFNSCEGSDCDELTKF